MYYTFENFINYSNNDYTIANESFSEFKSKIVKMFISIIQMIENGVRKMKDGKLKSALMRLLGRAKLGLSKSKSLNEHDKAMAQDLANEANDIKEQYNKVKNQSQKNNIIDLGEDIEAEYDNPSH